MTPMMHERVRNMFGDAGLTTGFTVQQLMYDDPGDLSKAIMVF
ncbi:TPA: phage tail termination protein, partial [Enterobacter kobei]